VIGGGDFAADRLVPDIYRAKTSRRILQLRHPHAVRPWQHVLDCLTGYLAFIQLLARRHDVPRALNFGPSNDEPVPVVALVEAVQTALGIKPEWRVAEPTASAEAPAIVLDSTLARQTLGWRDRLVGPAAIKATAEWYLAFEGNSDIAAHTLKSISDYFTP
jgi:CDP-glucose 4,6-dehydratase